MKEDTEKAILEFCRQYTGVTILNQVRDNIAMLSMSIDRATEQAKKNAESSDRIARSLIIVTFCLVPVGILQALVALFHR
jgi:CHASE3 domain sensor protein